MNGRSNFELWTRCGSEGTGSVQPEQSAPLRQVGELVELGSEAASCRAVQHASGRVMNIEILASSQNHNGLPPHCVRATVLAQR